uniref:Uncharacterized protein n=1 Tax=Tanacetum cinerariifolium TaxID=118510 RepID=A0A6L2N6V4_TANCI|nr:hypothetical protein [Tanacetum cinerariifolium]
MFKVFNRCLATRTSGHDQTKINIIQVFHVVVNRTNVDFAALLWWDFMNCVFQKKDVIQYPRFTKLIIAELMKKFPSISLRLEEDYHSINDDIPLVSVYTTGNVIVRGILIPDVFLTKEIRATNNYKEYEMVFDRAESHKENPEVVDEDEVKDKVKKDENKDDDAEKTDVATKEKDNDDHIDHTLVGSGSMETRNEQMQTLIPTPTRSPEKDLSSDKKISKELMANV